MHLRAIYSLLQRDGTRTWDYTCFKRTVGRHARETKEADWAPVNMREGGPAVCLFKFGSTRGKQACASRATDTRDLRARSAIGIRTRSSAKCSRRCLLPVYARTICFSKWRGNGQCQIRLIRLLPYLLKPCTHLSCYRCISWALANY